MDFRKKLLALSVSAMAFAVVAAAQSPCITPTNNTGLPNILRVEGTNDLATDVVIACAGPNTLASGSVVVQLNASVTSKQVSPTLNEATLLINVAGVYTQYPGVVSGNQVVFGGSTGVTFPAGAYTLEVANIRVNSSALAIGTYVTETVNVYNQGVVAFTSTGVGAPVQANVGYVQQGFAVPNDLANGIGPATSVVGPYAICQPNNTLSFTITLAEKFGGAFKSQTPTVNALTCGGAPCTETNGEQGSFVGDTLLGNVIDTTAPTGVGTANSGTRFQFAYAGIPSGVTLYVPITVVGTGTSAPLTFQLTASATGAFSPVAASVPATSGLPAGYAAITATNGTATAVYEVTTTDNTVPTESITIPGIFFFAADFATTALPAVTVTVTPAPTGSTNVPNFAPSSNPAINLNAWSVCQTSLLFPFVTNQLGFDTGIVLANTSTDPFAAPGGAVATPGSCALNFYGAGAPTPSTGVAAPGGSQASGTTNAFQVSSVAPGFQGYLIAVCNYQYGHGYAFIEYDLTQGNGIAEGYLGLVITGTRGQTTPEALNN